MDRFAFCDLSEQDQSSKLGTTVYTRRMGCPSDTVIPSMSSTTSAEFCSSEMSFAKNMLEKSHFYKIRYKKFLIDYSAQLLKMLTYSFMPDKINGEIIK